MSKLHPNPVRTATQDKFGVVRFANSAEAADATNDYTVMSPKDVADNVIVLTPTATTTQEGLVELATDAEAIAMSANNRALVPSNLAALSASETQIGLIEIATDAEAIAASETDKALVPSNLAALTGANLTALTASTTVQGLSELATDAEAIAAAATDRVLTPSNLAALTATNLTALTASTADVIAKTATDVYTTPASLAADGELQQTTVTISTAEMKAIETTPKTLVAAQAGKTIEFVSAMIVAQFNGVAFDDAAADGDLEIQYITANTVVSTTLDGDGFVDAVASTIKTIKPIVTDYTMEVNDGLELINDGAAYTGATADTTFSISVVYRVWDDQL